MSITRVRLRRVGHSVAPVGSSPGPQDDKESIVAIDGAGLTGSIQPPCMASFHSEEIVVGGARAEWPGPRLYVFTKCGLRSDSSGKIREVLKQTPSAASVKTACAVACGNY